MTFKAFRSRAATSRGAASLPAGSAAVVVALTYAIARLAASISLAAAAGSAPSFDPAGELAAAGLVGPGMAWLARRLGGSLRQRIAALVGLLFTSVAAVMIEGAVFAPALSPSRQLLFGLVLQLGVCVATAGVAVASEPSRAIALSRRDRSLPTLVVRIAGAGFVYVVAYFVTGALNYLLVTGPYYESHAGGLTTPEPANVLLVALAEGLLLTIGATPLAMTVTGSRWARALATGGALWVFGGLVPLLQETSLPDVIRVASAIEILFQKIPLGVAAVWLLAGSGLQPEPSLAGPFEGEAA